jgi:hypothetical protein
LGLLRDRKICRGDYTASIAEKNGQELLWQKANHGKLRVAEFFRRRAEAKLILNPSRRLQLKNSAMQGILRQEIL